MHLDKQYLTFREAARAFIDTARQNPDVIGIVLTGSFVHGDMDPNSDLDVYVILDASCDYRERGNTWIGGVEVEYFMNPPQQIRAYMQQEVSPHTAHMLAHGKVVYQRSEEITILIEEAQKRLDQPVPTLNSVQIELAKYQLYDLINDLEDSRQSGDHLAIALLKNQLLDQGVAVFCRIHRINRGKHKRLKQQLLAIDPGFVKLVEHLAVGDDANGHITEAFTNYLAGLLGGKRSQEWKLRSGLDL